MTREEAMATRLQNQQLSDSLFEKPEDIVGWFGMMQAQDYRQFKWAIGMRMKAPSREVVTSSFTSGNIIRLHLLRCTVQVVTAHDYPWMLDLCKERNLSTIKSWPSYNKTSFSEQYFQEATEVLKHILYIKHSLTKKGIGEELSKLGIPCDTAHLNQLLLRNEIEGVLVSGDLKENNATWALAEIKLSKVNARSSHHLHLSTDEALSLLAHKYFRSHSPATFEDFCWWTGLPISQNRRALQLIAADLEEINVESQNMFVYKPLSLVSHNVNNIVAGSKPDNLNKALVLLPPYDEYLIGYKSRWVALKKEHEPKAHNNFGIFHPVILYKGQVVGNWKLSTKKGAKVIDTDVFSRKREIDIIALEKTKNALQEFYVQHK